MTEHVRRVYRSRWSLRTLAVFAALALGAVGMMLAVTGGGAGGLTPPPTGQVVQKVDICHATGSQQNPYVINQPDATGDVSGHADHTGPIFTPGANSWGDIIPPFTFQDQSGTHTFAGLNWTAEGMAIYANDCNLVPVTTTAPVVTTQPVTPTTQPVTPTTKAVTPTTQAARPVTPQQAPAPSAVAAAPRTVG